MKPTILLLSASPSFSPARLAMALARSGCAVEAVCPSRHPLRHTAAVQYVHSYNFLIPLRSIRTAIKTAKPDLLVPCDDLTVSHLHDLYFSTTSEPEIEGTLGELIQRSLGTASHFPVLYDRAKFLGLAQAEGVRVPRTEIISSLEDLAKWSAVSGFPAVLKANGTSGGDGVRVVQSIEEAKRAFRLLQAPPLLARALKRALADQDMALLWRSLLRKPYVVNAQTFVSGREATSAVACWNGKVLASLQFEVLSRQHAGGPSTVLRLIENNEMSAAAEKVACRLDLSGLHGFDFILDSKTAEPYLIEINPRATQVGHLTLGAGHDLTAALYAALSGEALRASPKVTENDTIALFPQEWLRNPASPLIRSGYHDVPWEEPELVLVCVQRWKQRRAWYSPDKWIQALSKARQPMR